MGQRKLVAHFEMKVKGGVPLHMVHRMLKDVDDRFKGGPGSIGMTLPCPEHGTYYVGFADRNAADMFERLYRQTGKTPKRSQRPPMDTCIVAVVVPMADLLASLHDFMHYMSSPARNAQWN